MNTVRAEILDLEERLRLAEMGPDPTFFEEALADDVVLVTQDGASFAKSRVVEAHQPDSGPKFTRVEMTDMRIIDHAISAVVTCQGTYESLQSTATLKFMRVWLKKDNCWQIIAGWVSN